MERHRQRLLHHDLLALGVQLLALVNVGDGGGVFKDLVQGGIAEERPVEPDPDVLRVVDHPHRVRIAGDVPKLDQVVPFALLADVDVEVQGREVRLDLHPDLLHLGLELLDRASVDDRLPDDLQPLAVLYPDAVRARLPTDLIQQRFRLLDVALVHPLDGLVVADGRLRQRPERLDVRPLEQGVDDGVLVHGVQDRLAHGELVRGLDLGVDLPAVRVAGQDAGQDVELRIVLGPDPVIRSGRC